MSVEDRVSALSAAKKELLRRRLTVRVASAEGQIPIAPRGDQIPASFSQERMFLFQRMYPDAIPYNSQVALHFTGPLDESALEQCLNSIVGRHEIYRTSLRELDGRLVQQVHEPQAAAIQRVDLTHLGPTEADEHARRLINDQIARPFHLEALPLVRWTLIRLDPERHILLCMDHHAVTDGWSRHVVFKELMASYSVVVATGRLPETPAPRLQFADFAAWQHQWLASPEGRAQIEYWQRKLTGSPAILDLPYDRSHPTWPSFRGGHELMRLGEAELEPLRRVTALAQATMFMTVLAVFLVMLRRYSRSDDFCVGTGIANRRLPDTDDLIGMLINTVVLRVDMSGNPTFKTLVERVRLVTLEAYANQEAPFEKVVEAVAPARRPGVNPLHEVMFNFQNNPMPAMDFAGVETRLERPLFNGSAKFDLYVAGWPRSSERRGAWQRDDNDVLLSWEYNTDVFDTGTIRRMQAHFRMLLIDAGAHPEKPIAELRMADETELAQIETWAGTAAEEREHRSVHALVEEHALSTPERVAVVAGESQMTYRELNERADRLADGLRALDVGRDALVGVCLERSIDQIVCLLGVLKAGGAYVPLDPAYPSQKLAALMTTCMPRIVLTSRELASRLAQADAEADAKIVIAKDLLVERDVAPLPPAAIDADSLAYVPFTSGSTGEPRAVAVPHRAIVRLVRDANFARADPTQTWLHASPLSFDASTLEIWGPLCNGGRLVLMPGGAYTLDAIEHAITSNGVTSLWLTAGLFQLMVNERIGAFAGLKQVLTGGDVVSVDAVRRLLDRFPALCVINGYGPTENTTFTTCRPVTVDDLSRPRLPIGRPIAGTTVHILDANGDACPIGLVGELCTGGLGLARGFLNDPEATARKFVVHPLYGRLYHTGDLARFLPDGSIDFLGRVDRQVKIRGYRIELGEIEAALRKCSGVGHAVVESRGESAAEKVLVAYIVPKAGEALPSSEDLRATLRTQLQEHAQPSVYQFVKRVPLTPNGKIDHAALSLAATVQADVKDTTDPSSPVAPSNDVETALSAIWRDVLGVDQLTPQDNFFDCGGHSLLAMQLVARIRDEMRVDLPLRAVFEHPTVEALAKQVVAEGSKDILTRRNSSPWKFLFELTPGASGRPVFFIPGGHGGDYEFLVYARLVHFVGGGYRFLGLRARSADGLEAAQHTVEEMASDYLHEIQRLQPGGPYLLIGNCVGGVLAYELARQMRRAGAVVETLVLMDTDYPTSKRYARYLWDRISDDLSTKLERLARNLPLDYYRKRVSDHREAFRTLRWTRRLQYLLGRTNTVWRDGVEVVRDAVEPTSSEAEEAIRNTYVDALRRYRPKSYRGSVKVIMSEEKMRSGRAARWSRVVRGTVYPHPVPGDHEAYIRDHVKIAAQQLRVCLDRDQHPPTAATTHVPGAGAHGSRSGHHSD